MKTPAHKMGITNRLSSTVNNSGPLSKTAQPSATAKELPFSRASVSKAKNISPSDKRPRKYFAHSICGKRPISHKGKGVRQLKTLCVG